MSSEPKEEALIPIEEIETPEMQEVEGGFQLLKIPNDEELTKAVGSMENAIKFVERIQAAVLQRTRPGDWVLRDGKPYFTEAGCNRFRAPFGIYSKDIKSWTIDADGNRREIGDRNVYSGDVRFIFVAGVIGSKLLGVEAYFEGGSKLDDGFKEKDDVLFYAKKARANWYGSGIRKLTGMENFRVDDLEKAGIDVKQIQAIQSVKTEKADSAEAQELHNMLVDLNDGDVKKAEDYLFKLTDNPEKKFKGKTRASQLSAGQMKWIMPKVHSEWAKKFPEKSEKDTANPAKPANETTNEGHTQSNDGFLNSIKAIRSKGVSDADYAAVLKEFKVEDPFGLSNGDRNKFLIQLGKKVKA